MVVTDRVQQVVTYAASAATLVYGFVTGEAAAITVALGVLATPGLLKFAVSARGVRVEVQKVG